MLVLYDVVAVTGAYFIALWFRFDCQFSAIPTNFYNAWVKFAPFYAGFCVLCLGILPKAAQRLRFTQGIFLRGIKNYFETSIRCSLYGHLILLK